MDLIPAIDLLDAQCVRLRQGDYKQCQYYNRQPTELAADYDRAGAQWLHVVDLAASRDGKNADTRPLFALLSAASQKVQTGGGVRDASDIESRFEAGAARVVIGSLAADEPDRFVRWLERFGPGAMVAALDVCIDEGGTPRVRSHGWTRDSDKGLWALLDFYSDRRLQHVLVTDIGRDGLLSGPNLELYRQVTRRYRGLHVQASGGIRDLRDLVDLAATGAAAAISGKALLEGRFTVEGALEALGGGA